MVQRIEYAKEYPLLVAELTRDPSFDMTRRSATLALISSLTSFESSARAVTTASAKRIEIDNRGTWIAHSGAPLPPIGRGFWWLVGAGGSIWKYAGVEDGIVNNAKHIGFKCDGKTDDTRAYLAAMAAKLSYLRWPPGTCRIASLQDPVSTSGMFAIEGAGSGVNGTVIDFRGSRASFLYVAHDFSACEIRFRNHMVPSSANGGSIFYSLDKTAGDTNIIKGDLRGVIFDACVAPVNIEGPFNGMLIRNCWSLGGAGHPLRFGTAASAHKWATWRGVNIDGWHVRNLSTSAPGQNVYAALIYGEQWTVKNMTVDGVTGSPVRRAGANYDPEAGGLHIQGRNGTVVSGWSRNVSGAPVVRHVMAKGEQLGENFNIQSWTASCGGVPNSEGLAWYVKSGQVTSFVVIDPGLSGVTLGSGAGKSRSELNGLVVTGRNRPGVYGVTGALESGFLSMGDVSLTNLVRPISITTGAQAGGLEITGAQISGGLGTAIEIYTYDALPTLTVKGSISNTNNSYCVWIRGPGGVHSFKANYNLTTKGGFGTVLDTTVVNIALEQDVAGTTNPGRELAMRSLPSGRIATNIAAQTKDGKAVTGLVLPMRDDASVSFVLESTAHDGKDEANYSRAGSLRMGRPILDRSANNALAQAPRITRTLGASSWDAQIGVRADKAVVQFTGQAGKSVTHSAKVQLTIE